MRNESCPIVSRNGKSRSKCGGGCNLLTPFLRLLVIAAALALLLPLFSPMLDHHFTERQTGHVHIYQRGLPVQHLQSYAIPPAQEEDLHQY